MSRRRALAVLLAAAVLAPAGPASAASLDVVDGRGDVWTYDVDPQSPKTYRRAPEVARADVTRATYTLTDRRVTVTVRLAELGPGGGPLHVRTRMRAGDGVRHVVGLSVTRRHPDGVARLTDYHFTPVDCAVRHRVDPRRDLLRVGFPARCVGGPASLEFTSAVARRVGGLYHFDNPHTSGPNPKGWTAPVRRERPRSTPR